MDRRLLAIGLLAPCVLVVGCPFPTGGIAETGAGGATTSSATTGSTVNTSSTDGVTVSSSTSSTATSSTSSSTAATTSSSTSATTSSSTATTSSTTSTTSGGTTCDMQPDCMSCGGCATNGTCSGDYIACQADAGGSGCIALLQCLQGCNGNTGCINQCFNNASVTAQVLFNNLRSCVCGQCSNTCAGQGC